MRKILTLVLLLLIFTACGKKEEQPVKPSGHYKQLTLVDFNNIMNQNVGKVVIVNFFATWCPPCRKEIPELINLTKEYKDKNLTIIGISVDENGEEAVAPFAKQVGFNYPVFLTTPELITNFNIDAVPQIFIYDKSGKLITNLKGFVDARDLKLMIDKLI
ncbi:MAG: TlpA family protein disulfide reductase [Proteobacteria bacterium]|nr:TlpA family protein disulfide reductase [Pseudomonadota bacterium]